MERILSESRNWERAGQLAAYASLKILTREFDVYVQQNEIPGWGYIQEKLSSLNFHVSALYQIDEDNGHDAHSHHLWALGDLEALRRNIPEQE